MCKELSYHFVAIEQNYIYIPMGYKDIEQGMNMYEPYLYKCCGMMPLDGCIKLHHTILWVYNYMIYICCTKLDKSILWVYSRTT